MKYMRIILISWMYFGLLGCNGENLERCPAHLPRNNYLRIHGNKCYRFITTEVSWPSARNSCYRSGGMLITITTRDEQIFIERAMQDLWTKNGMWLGAHDRVSEMDWYWLTGQKVRSSFQNWDRGQPSCFLPNFLCHEDCAVIRKDEGYKWHDYLCNSDLYEYGYTCEYDLLPEPTKPTPPVIHVKTTTIPSTSTTSSTTTTVTTTKTTTTKKTPPPKTEGPTITTTTTTMVSEGSTKENVTILLRTPENILVETQKLSSEESGMKTGSMVGLIVSFVLVFFAGLIIGIILCRRRYRKQYDESMSVGFNNVLYTAAPYTAVPTKVKDTNIMVAAEEDMTDEEVDHRYVDIDEITTGKCNNVDLPPQVCKDVNSEPDVACLKDNEYETVTSHCEEAGADVEVGGACGEDPPPPPPCTGVHVQQFAPEFLMKDTDVSQAYSNNLYGYTK